MRRAPTPASAGSSSAAPVRGGSSSTRSKGSRVHAPSAPAPLRSASMKRVLASPAAAAFLPTTLNGRPCALDAGNFGCALRQRQGEIADAAIEIEHPVCRDRCQQSDGLIDHAQIDFRVHLNEIHRTKAQRQPIGGNRVAEVFIGLQRIEWRDGFRTTGLQVDSHAHGQRKVAQQCPGRRQSGGSSTRRTSAVALSATVTSICGKPRADRQRTDQRRQGPAAAGSPPDARFHRTTCRQRAAVRARENRPAHGPSSAT